MPNYTSGSYNAKLREIRDLYFKIGHVKCPCLNNKYVYFNQVGFRHLIRKGRIIRHIPDQLRRFALFRFATKIITSDKTKIVEMRQNRDILSCAMTLDNQEVHNIKVVVIKNSKGLYLYVSVMD